MASVNFENCRMICQHELKAELDAVRWGDRWGSNPRQQESQSWTLPTELRPPLKRFSILAETKIIQDYTKVRELVANCFALCRNA